MKSETYPRKWKKIIVNNSKKKICPKCYNFIKIIPKIIPEFIKELLRSFIDREKVFCLDPGALTIPTICELL